MTSFFSNLFTCCKVERKDMKYDIEVDTTSPNISVVSSPMKKTLKKGTVNTTNLSTPKTETTLSFNKNLKSSIFKDSAVFLSTKNVLQFTIECPEYIPSEEVVKSSLIPNDYQGMSLLNLKGNILQKQIILNLKEEKDECQIIKFFWLKSDNNKTNYILNYTEPSLSQDYIFLICYIPELNLYKLKFNPILLAKEISTNFLIQVSDTYPTIILPSTVLYLDTLKLQLNPLSNGVIEIVNLNNKKRYLYHSIIKKEITIGRGEECDLSFPSYKNISKVQSTIYFDVIKRQWMIRDGYDDMSSEKGTWIFSINPILVYNGMVINLWDNFIQCKFDV